MSLRVFAWNPNGLRSLLQKSKKAIQDFLKEERPDILFFPESKGNPKTEEATNKTLKETFNSAFDLDRHWIFHHTYCLSTPGRHGNTVAIATDNVNVHTIDDNKDDEGRIIRLRCSSKSHPDDIINIVGAYVPNASTNLVRLQFKLDWLKSFANYINSLGGEGVVVIGDINVAPDERDLANPKTNKKTPGFTPQEREGFAEFMNQCGLVDVWRTKNPNDKVYSFWSTRTNARERNIGWRIDLCLTRSLRATDSIICTHVLGSDHCPIGIFIL